MNKLKTKLHTQDEAGFTIVELMIATVVFALVMLVITVGIVHFTNAFYKSVNTSTAQDTTRSALDSIEQAIQFSGLNQAPSTMAVASPGVVQAFCTGGKQFLYTLGTPVGSVAGKPGLYVQGAPVSGCAVVPAAGGQELLGAHMRLTAIGVSPVAGVTNVYSLNIGVAYGDSDLLCNTSKNGTSGGCGSSDAANSLTQTVTGNDVKCKPQTGSEFCDVVVLTTAAQQRAAS